MFEALFSCNREQNIYTVEPPLTATPLRRSVFMSRRTVHTFALILTSPQRQRPLELVPIGKTTSQQRPVKRRLTTKRHFVIGKGHESWSLPRVVGLCFWFIDISWLRHIFICYNQHFFFKWKCCTPKRMGVTLHIYLPITATSLQSPFFSPDKIQNY